jgi:IS5 family transposase
MVLVDGQSLPLGVRLESASPHEVTLAEATLQEVSVPQPKGRPRQKPERVIADTAYDSDPLRQRLQKRGIELIVPYRENNQQRRRRWAQIAPLQTALDRRTNQLLAWPVPTLAGPA